MHGVHAVARYGAEIESKSRNCERLRDGRRWARIELNERRRRERRPGLDLEDLSVRIGNDVQLAIGIDAKCRNETECRPSKRVRVLMQRPRGRFACRWIDVQFERPHTAPDEIGKKVLTDERRIQRRPVIDKPPDDRLSDAVVVLNQRKGHGLIGQRQI